MNLPAWLNAYVGIPYADGGHDLKSVSCWGLCHLVLKEQCGIETPTYGEYSSLDLLSAAREFRANAESPLWRNVDLSERQPFDLILMHAMTDDKRHRVPGHCGILVTPDRLLHVWKETASVHMPIDHPRVRHRIISFHRHADLT